MSLEDYKNKFARLRVNVAHGRASPHKICMLLSLLDLARSGKLAFSIGINYDSVVGQIDLQPNIHLIPSCASDVDYPRVEARSVVPEKANYWGEQE